MAKVAVIGAGAMGLAAAYHLAKAGHNVEVFEADKIAGGMAAHFDLAGLSIERFYHFVCKADQPTFDLLKEIGLGDAMRWRPTSMGYFYNGRLYPWGDPISLLKFPHLGLLSKIRYGLMAFLSTKRSDWSKLDKITAEKWLKDWCGPRGWDVLWEKLFALKFFEYADKVSAAWMWTRLKRVGTSRRNLFQEELGYIGGGSETLVKRLVERIEALGGLIHLGAPVSEVHIENGAVSGVTAGGVRHDFTHVISTMPLPLIPKLIPGLSAPVKEAYARLENIGVVCVVHKLKRSVTKHFWLNTNDPAIEIPGIVEFSNLRPVEHTVVYVPYYMPITHPKFAWSDEALIAESFGYLKRINPDIQDSDRIASALGRLKYAQPICPPGFLDMLPPIESEIRGLQIADTSSYYPEDRGISEGVRVAREMAARVQ
ncbi:MAG: NAD(P)/FAD-dependent oxidoreductase [Rhodospirillaceae bacterium]